MHPKIHAPIEIMGVIIFGEQAAVARPEIELQGHRRIEFVLQTDDAVGAALAKVAACVPDSKDTLIPDSVPAVADAGANTHQTVKATREMPLEHEVGVQLQRPDVNAGKVQVAETSIGHNIFGAQIHLEGEMIASEGLEREGLHVAHRDTYPILIRGLSLHIH